VLWAFGTLDTHFQSYYTGISGGILGFVREVIGESILHHDIHLGWRSYLYLLLVAVAAIPGFVDPLPTPALAQSPSFNLDPIASANLLGVTGNNSVAWGDYDNDGDLDILMAGQIDFGNPMMTAAIYRNDGGSFTDTNAGLMRLGYGSAAWGDYDNDGDLDILLTGLTDDYKLISKIYRNDGGSFSDTDAGPLGVGYGSAAWGDYDNDGDLDILLTGLSSNRPLAQVYQNNAGVFADISAGLVGVGCGSATWGDYDNDGDLDILMAGQIDFDNPMLITAIYRNDSGSFTYANPGLVGVGYGSAAWGDYDNDGDLDILLTGNSNPDGDPIMLTEIYRNDGGSFTNTNAGLVGVGYGSAAWGDYDNDGDLDILLTGNSNSGGNLIMLTEIYRNDGGSFTDTNAGLPGVAESDAAWGDYDNDGDLDILLTGRDSSGPIAQIYRNDLPATNTQPSAPTGLAAVISGTTANLRWDAAADSQTPTNGLTYNLRLGRTPGAVDVLAPMADEATGYRRIPWLGNAQHGLTATLTLPAGTYYWSAQAIDTAFAGSAFAPEQSFTVTSVLTPPTAVTLTGPTAGQVGFTYTFTATVTPVTVTLPITYAWNFGDGVTALGPASTITHTWATSGVHTVAVAAMNEGGVAVGTYSVTIASAFTNINAGLTGVSSGSAAWGDYDNDGDLDILLAGSSNPGTRITKIYRNDGGSFTDTYAGLPGFYDGSAAWGDYDNDGDLDILLTGIGPDLRTSRVYRNDGGNFTDANAGLAGINDGAAAWGDYDNDGDLDIVLAGWLNSGSAITRIYRNDGGSFTDANAGLANIAHSAVAWGDYDNDGDLDILLSGYGLGQNDAKIYRNDGGSFTDTNAGLLNLIHSDAAWGDYDNDGDLDILLSGQTYDYHSFTKIYRNDGGSFTDTNAGLAGVAFSNTAWGDYDNDGDLDILLMSDVSWGSVAQIYRNDGGIFTAVDVELARAGNGSVVWGDYDNDGDLDILLTGSGSSGPIAQIYRNDLPATNTKPSAPSGLAAVISGTTANLRWDAAADSQTPTNGLTYNLRVGRTPGAVDVLAPMADGATGYRRIPWLGNAQHGLTATLTLPAGTYYWSAQAIDTAFAGSAFAPEQIFTVIQPPTALTLAGPTAGQVGFTYGFTATVTPAMTGLPITYTWQADDHGLVTYTDGLSNSVAFSWTTAGIKTIAVTATNAGGTITGTTTMTITDVSIAGLSARNSSPTELGQATTLTATVTAGSNVSYTWAFGDSSSGSGANPSHIYPAVGVYTAVVTASNSVNIITAPTIITVTGTPVLTISKAGPVSAEIGEIILYTLTVTNNGNDTATGLVITDVIPSGATYISGGTKVDKLVSWTGEALAPNQSIQVQFSVTATGSITNSNYGVRAAGGYSAMGNQAISTKIESKVFLPIIIK
jgi:uncharacterized repeat protein (TIGR01451 family)